MSVRRTYGDVKDAVAAQIGTCSTDPRTLTYANNAVEVLMSRGRWVGTYQRYRICADKKGCLTWPRQIETIEAWALCNLPGIVRNEWFEWVQGGPGLGEQNTDAGMNLEDRGNHVTFDDPQGVDKLLRVYADVTEDPSARLLVQGYDQNNNWIRTREPLVTGPWVDGEYIAITASGPTNSVNIFTSITGVIKPVTNGNVRVYTFLPSDSSQAAIAVYEPDETKPIYRRSQIPNLENLCCLSTCGGTSPPPPGCDKKKITVMAKLRFIPVSRDDDWMLISNLNALKLMVKALLKQEQNLLQEAEMYEQKAIQELDKELQVYQGDGAVGVPRFPSRFEWGGGGVNNII